ncbi:hypothetical protein H0H92_013655, partial [Tricholoma furcatifolium]
VLALAPHLGRTTSKNICSDPVLNKTRRLKLAYGAEKSVDVLINRAQLEELREPISRSLWKLIIMDRYVNFEHLHASLENSYDYEDEAKDFAAEFSIVKKDSLTKRKSVSTESEWIRLFDAWRDRVLVFYVHRKDELSSYKDYISKIFRASPLPSTAISLDREVRESYARQPFRMDDLHQLSLPMLSQLDRLLLHPPLALANEPQRSVKIGIWDTLVAKGTRVGTTVGTVSAANAMGLTEPKTMPSALRVSNANEDNNEELLRASLRAAKAKVEGPRQLAGSKRKAVN